MYVADHKQAPPDPADELPASSMMEQLYEAMEADDEETVKEKLDRLSKKIEAMTDRKTQIMYYHMRSIFNAHQRQQGVLREALNIASAAMGKCIETERLSKLLYAWFMYMKTVDKRFEMPPRDYGYGGGQRPVARPYARYDNNSNQ